MLWSFTRIFIRTPAGRQRFNVLGALNATTKELLTVTTTTYITAVQVCELMEKIAALAYTIPVTFVLDNARYQKCQLFRECAQRLHIDLLYLPPYSPNLNLIERLWKFVKKKALYSRYYDSFVPFQDAIMTVLTQTSAFYKEELDDLLTLKFQTFEKSQIVGT